MNLDHAPCGVSGDIWFPDPDGSIGAWGYDFEDGGRLVSPSTPDLMSYCDPAWVSDYHFTKALRYRLADEGYDAAATVAPKAQSLLLWGGTSPDGVPFWIRPSAWMHRQHCRHPAAKTGSRDAQRAVPSSFP